MKRRNSVLLAALALGLALTGCSGQGSQAVQPSPSTSAVSPIPAASPSESQSLKTPAVPSASLPPILPSEELQPLSPTPVSAEPARTTVPPPPSAKPSPYRPATQPPVTTQVPTPTQEPLPVPEPTPDPQESAAFADGSYTASVTLEGGSGKATVESPAVLRCEGGQFWATIVWSSPNFDYMKVNGTRYDPINTEGNSTFEIPVAAFDQKLEVIADTVAMSEPHEVAYTLQFSAASLKSI